MKRILLTSLLFLFLMGLFYFKIFPLMVPHINQVRNQWTLERIMGQDDEKVARILKDAYIEPNLKNPTGDTLLIWAVSMNMPKTARQLLVLGANPTLTDVDGVSPLMYAVSTCPLEVATMLFKAGAPLDTKDHQKRSALFYAVQNPSLQPLEWLLKMGSDPNISDSQGVTPLHLAVNWNSREALELLITHGADIMAQDDLGRSPLKQMELSPFFSSYIQRPIIKANLPSNYLETLPIEDLTREPPPEWKLSDLQKLIHQKVNQKRIENGLAPYSYDTSLERLALSHSKDMAEKKFFAHVNLQGESPNDRAIRLNIPIETHRDGKILIGVAENLFMCSLKQSIAYYFEKGEKKQTVHWHTAETISNSVVEGWMNSPGHRKNLLSDNLREHGLGICISQEGQFYVSEEMR